MSFSQQYNAVGSLAYHSQRTRKPFSAWTWWIVSLPQGYAVGSREGGREEAYPGLWEVHQNSHCSSSSRCRQSWACLLRLSAESCWRNLFHAGVMLFSVLSDSFSPSSFFPVLLSLRSRRSLLKCKCASERPFKCICSLALTSSAFLCALAADSSLEPLSSMGGGGPPPLPKLLPYYYGGKTVGFALVVAILLQKIWNADKILQDFR